MAGIAMEIPVSDGAESSPPMIPPRLRSRLSQTKTAPSSIEEIEAKLRDADLRRQKFYEHLSSKTRPKPRSPSQSSSLEEDIGRRLEAKLEAAEQKRLSMLTQSQMRLAKLDELRRAAKTEVEMRSKKKQAELGSKVELKVKQAEANRMLILTANRQRRAKMKERTSQSFSRRMARESKYKERVCAAICQKRLAAENKRLGLLEEDKKRVRARVLQVRKVANSVSQQREIERRKLRAKLDDKLKRAKRQRADYLMQRTRLHNSLHDNFNKMHEQADLISRKLARCWKKFCKLKRTTLDLTKAYNDLNIKERTAKSMPFEQLAILIESSSTLQTAKALLDRLEIRYKASQAVTSTDIICIDHLLKRVASPKRRSPPRKSARIANKAAPTILSRYPVRVVLCAYMILGHPDAVLSGQGEREMALEKSAWKFIREFELLVKIILTVPIESSAEVSKPALEGRWTFRSQLAAFDAAWCSYLNSFVVWKVKDAESLEDDLVRAACQLEVSMIKKCKLTPEGETSALTHDMKAIQKQVTEDQKLLREKVLHLSGDAGIVRMDTALSDARIKYFQVKENGNPVGTHILSSSSPPTSVIAEVSEKPNHVIRSLFNDVSVRLREDGSAASISSVNSLDNQNLDMENELIVNEILHEQGLSFDDSLSSTNDGQNIKAKVRETIENAFWDSITESVKQEEPKYDQIIELVKEVRDEIMGMAPQSWKQEITEAIDVDILSQLLNSGKLDMDHLRKILEYAMVTLQKLSAPASEDEMKMAHQNLLKELGQICQSGDESKNSHVIALMKGLRFLLESIQALKQEISKARIKIMEPLLKGPAGFNYLKKGFAKRHGPPSSAMSALPLTLQWFSSWWDTKDQEWCEHTDSLLEPAQRLLPSSTLRTGGSSSFKMNGGLASTSAGTKTTDKQYPECKGEKVDLLVRLGLLKLVSQVSGLTEEELPETLKLNLFRLRAVQAQVQKIIVIATSILVLRQTLISEQVVGGADMEVVIMHCVKQLSELVDTVEHAGIKEIVEILNQTVGKYQKEADEMVKVEARKDVFGRMLKKSLQAEDPVFVRVSRAVYLAARGVVLGGSNGIELTRTALKKVGAAVLTDMVVEAAAVLVVAATVSVGIHGPWYAVLVDKCE